MRDLITRRDGAIGWILFSNPARHNSVTYEMLRALPDAVATFDRDPNVRVIALTGQGEDFGSGGDIHEFGTTRQSVAATETYSRATHEAYAALTGAAKPVAARIRGVCFGLSFSLITYCDLRIAADSAEFAQPIARYGLGLSFASTNRLVGLIGAAHAAEILYTARHLTAAEALAIGLLHRVVPAAELDQAFAEACGRVARNAPLSLLAAKLAIRAAIGDPGHLDERTLQAAIDACHASEDALEGRRAFAEKRRPNFRGR
jgi:enoyl-CoA hydratase/carnithine racemase